MMRILSVLILGLILLLPAPGMAAPDEQKEKVDLASAILDEIMRIPEQGIPPSLLADAAGIAIIPNVLKVGLVVGGRYGAGVLLLRGADGRWSNPSFISLTGGSFGWQIGAQSTDLICVFKRSRSIEGIMDGKFTLGADAAVAAGPVGRNVQGATDASLKAEIYSYSSSRGLFAGISLEGAALQIDEAANGLYYRNPGISARAILNGSGGFETPEVRELKERLVRYAPRR
jgi:lipid-binding SYLF domain-containing protein